MTRDAVRSLTESERASRKSRDLEQLERRMRGGLGRYWRQQRDALMDGLDGLRRHFQESPASDFDRLFSAVENIDGGALTELADQLNAEAARRGAGSSGLDVGLHVDLDLENPAAVAFLRRRGAEMVTNIDAETRRQLRGVLVRGIEDRRSYSEVADTISTRFRGFSDRSALGHIRDRAELVAVQELGMAYEAGSQMVADDLTRAGWKLERQIIVTPDDRLCPECIDAESAGWIAHGETFPGGVISAPIHVGCRCATATRTVQGTPTAADLPGDTALIPA